MKKLKLESLIIDFEYAANLSFNQVFQVRITTCFYHFTKIIWCHLQSSGKVNEYNKNKNFKFKVKQSIILYYCLNEQFEVFIIF
jgi:hypothetical protein